MFYKIIITCIKCSHNAKCSYNADVLKKSSEVNKKRSALDRVKAVSTSKNNKFNLIL